MATVVSPTMRMRFLVFAFFQTLRSLAKLGWLFFLGLRLFFAVVVVLRVIARHCIAFGLSFV